VFFVSQNRDETVQIMNETFKFILKRKKEKAMLHNIVVNFALCKAGDLNSYLNID